MINYYDLLGIDPAASPEEIHAAYLFQIKAFHPDRYDPDKQPAAHIRAAHMTQRLNQARDTLSDPATRRTYDSELFGGSQSPPPPPPAPPAPPPPSQRSGRLPIGLAVLAVAFILLAQLHSHPAAPKAAAINPTPVPCPTGAPAVNISRVTVYPNPEDPGFGRPTRLYVVQGTVSNLTDREISLSTLGFYLGNAPLELAPTWTDEIGYIETSTDPNSLPAHGQLTFTERHAVTLPDGLTAPFPATVTGSLNFPPSDESRPQAGWWWTNAGPGCPATPY
jgi:hypothetical protein